MNTVFHLFERFGIELEYMIVDRDTMKVYPLTDKVLHAAYGDFTNEVTMGDIAWSNELALHVIELKVAEPAFSIENLDSLFHANIHSINDYLAKHNACLMGGPMHPLMDPIKEIRLWPHDYNPIYNAFDRIFSCKGHGWANLQSMHINLPFANDDEFGRLHTAIRLILPIIPALSAGSPIVDGKVSGFHDTRMEVYRTNSSKIPLITGKVIPEAVFTQEQYEEEILQPIYHALDPFDPDKILQEEWVNSRGAIARFERNTIEIRVIDVQETPSADIAIAAAVINCVKMLVEEECSSYVKQKGVPLESLVEIFLDCIKNGKDTLIFNDVYLSALGLPVKKYTTCEVWEKLIQKSMERNTLITSDYYRILKTILDKGTLSTRILKYAGPNPEKQTVVALCNELCNCLRDGKMLGIPV